MIGMRLAGRAGGVDELLANPEMKILVQKQIQNKAEKAARKKAAQERRAASNAKWCEEYRLRCERKAARAAKKLEERKQVEARKATRAVMKPFKAKERYLRRRRDPKKENARTAAWAAANPEKRGARCARRRAVKRSVIATPDANFIIGEIRAHGGWCFYCDETLLHGEAHADHVIPLAQIGPHAAINLVCACVKCNTSKGAKTPSQWDGLPAIHADRALTRERQIYEWHDAHILYGEAS
jgi:5-methylcytosine-specific restriction endonuclease McrA